MKDNTKIIKNLNLASYKKKCGKFSQKMLSFSKKEVEAFDKANKTTGKAMLKGKRWALIGDRYYQLPKSGTAWFRNMSVAGRTAVCLLGAGVVGGAVATPIIITNLNNKAVDVVIEKGEGIKEITKSVDEEGNTTLTAEFENPNDGLNGDSVEIYVNGEKLPEEEVEDCDIEDDKRVILKKKFLEKYKHEVLKIVIKAILVSTPDKFTMNPSSGRVALNADIIGDVRVPAQVNGVKVKEVDTSKMTRASKQAVTSMTLSNNIEKVNEAAFKDFVNMTSVRMSDNIPTLPKEALYGCSNLKEYKGGKNVKELGENCFGNNYKLERFVGKNVTTMGAGCFEITTKDIISALKEVILSDDLGKFPDRAFRENRSLTTVRGGKNAKEVGSYCYTNCFSLREADVLMSQTAERVGRDAFRNTSIEKLMINANAKMTGLGDSYFNSFKNDGMLASIYIENEMFANLDRYDHDCHGALDNAKTVFVKKGIKMERGEYGNGILDRFVLNEQASKQDSKYNVYETSNAKAHQTYQHYNDDETIDVGYRYCGNEEKVMLSKAGELPEALDRVNSHGLRDNKKVESVDLNRDGITFLSIGTDMENGHSFHGCELLREIKGIENLIRICAYSFMGTQLKEFRMPNISKENLGRGAFQDHKNRNMKLYLHDNQHELYNIENDDSFMFYASNEVFLPQGKTLDKLPSTAYLSQHKNDYKEEETTLSGTPVVKLTLKANR